MIAIGSDHAGYSLKLKFIDYLKENNLEYKDFGCDNPLASNYTFHGKAVALAVASGEFKKGILICGTGIGISIVANKQRGIRAALCNDVFSAKAARLHNDSNIVCFGARVIGEGHAVEVLNAFLNTEFSGEERHIERISEIED